MADKSYRALVVDDEAAVRSLTIRALNREGFSCDAAADGLEAQRRLESNRYDVVVTDLRMPNRNGHALASDLLLLEDRPIVVILTGVLEPKLAKDLMVRGADAIEFKPVTHDLFAAKVTALVRRRSDHSRGIDCDHEPGAGSNVPSGRQENETRNGTPAPSRSDIERKLTHLSRILPVSQAAFDVFSIASSDSYQVSHIAAAIARDASLSLDVLRLANSSFCNPSGMKVSELEEAVVRIGQRRIGELALATSAMGALTANVLPWMNVDLAWRRCIAAGVASDLLLTRGGHAGVEDGLFLSAIMHPLGRVALAMLYPQQYQAMVETCEKHQGALEEQEQRVFPMTPGEVMACVLEAWNIPAVISEPLKYVSQAYSALAGLAEPLRTKAELLKLALLLGGFATGEWESWDQIEFPPAQVLRRLAIESFSEIIREARSDSQEIITFRPKASVPKGKSEDFKKAKRSSCELAYCNLSPEPFDFLAEVIASTSITLRAKETDALQPDEKVLVNCIWSPPHTLAARLSPRHAAGAALIVTDATHLEPYGRFGRVLSLPTSYGAIRSACEQMAHAVETCRG